MLDTFLVEGILERASDPLWKISPYHHEQAVAVAIERTRQEQAARIAALESALTAAAERERGLVAALEKAAEWHRRQMGEYEDTQFGYQMHRMQAEKIDTALAPVR